MSFIEKIKEESKVSALSSIGSIGVYYGMIDSDLTSELPIFGQDVPIWAGIGATAFIGNQVGRMFNDTVIDKVDNELIKAAIPSVLAGAGTAATMKLLVSPNSDLMKSFIVGAAGSLIGEYANKML